MGRPPAVSEEDKLRIVLSVLAGETSIVDAARRNKVSENSVSRWKQQFVEGGRAGLAEHIDAALDAVGGDDSTQAAVIRHVAAWRHLNDVPTSRHRTG